MTSPYFTVFTPTYNRAKTLDRVYESLRQQTLHDFEWLIVDDGSTDNTGDLVREWQTEAPFSIRYIYQENSGKHVATNVGVREARGDLFLIFDSDDMCVPETLEQFKSLWESIPDERRSTYSTVSVLCVDSSGRAIGGLYPADVVEAENQRLQFRLRSSGERWGVAKTDVLRSFPFPRFNGEKFIPEGIVWNRMSRQYRTMFANRPLRIYEQRSDSLSASAIRIRAMSPIGTSLYYNELGLLGLPLLQKMKASANYVRFSLHGETPFTKIVKQAKSPLQVLLMIGVGYLAFRLDRYRI